MLSKGKHVSLEKRCLLINVSTRDRCYTVVPRVIFKQAKVRLSGPPSYSVKLHTTIIMQDLEATEHNIKSHYFPGFYGDYQGVFRDESSYHMSYLSHKTHKSLITLEFAADRIAFVEHRSPGRIVEALIEDFLALAGSGILTVVVQNTGVLTADYSVSAKDSVSAILIATLTLFLGFY